MAVTLTIDEMLEKIGSFGRYQWLLLGFCGYAMIAASAFPSLIITFIIAEPNWICVKTYNNSVCNFTEPITLTSDNYNARCSMPRDAWTYVDGFTSTVTEFDLVCDKLYLQSIARSCSSFGAFVGLIFGGYLADRFGRKIAFCFGIVTVVLSTWLMVPKHFAMFIVGRTLVGLGTGFKSSADFVLLTEFTGVMDRAKIGIISYYFWAIGYILLALIGYLLPNWRQFLLVTAAVATPLIFIMWWLLPESTHWLLLNGKPDKAKEGLAKIARINKKPYPEDELKQPEAVEKGNFLHLFSTFELRKRTFINWDIWISVALVYYGVSYSSVDLGWNIYLTFALTGFVELPANYLAIWAMNRYGRKKCTIFGLLTATVASVVAASIPYEQTSEVSAAIIIRIIMALIAKFAATCSFASICVWNVELYPTTIRGMAFSTSVAIENLGSFAASYLIWLIRIHTLLPFGIMGFMCFQSAILALLLPETNGQSTIETMDEICRKQDTIVSSQGEAAVNESDLDERRCKEKM